MELSCGLYEFGQKEPWFMATNTEYPFKSVVNAYGRRFEIEETNRISKMNEMDCGNRIIWISWITTLLVELCPAVVA